MAFANPNSPTLNEVEGPKSNRNDKISTDERSDTVEKKQKENYGDFKEEDMSGGIFSTTRKVDPKIKKLEESGSEDDDPQKSKVADERIANDGSSIASKRRNSDLEEDDEVDEEPVRKRSRRIDVIRKKEQRPAKSISVRQKVSEKLHSKSEDSGGRESSDQGGISTHAMPKASKGNQASDDMPDAESPSNETASEADDNETDSEEDKPEIAAKAREKVQSTLKSSGKDPYPDWPLGDPVPYAALCTTFSLIEMTTKRLVISAHCSLFLRQVLRLTPQDLLPTVQLMINKLAADYSGIELGIGESLIMKAIGESTGRSLQVIKADQKEIGDLGLVAAKSRSNQPTMYKPKALTVKGVLDGLMNIATISGDGSQGRKIAGIKKLLSAADTAFAGKGSKGIDITKDKGGASEAKFIIRFLEAKLRLGLAGKTVLVALAHAMVIHETEKGGNKLPSSEQLARGESILKTVYRYRTLA